MLRFNRRWAQFLERLNLEPINTVIDQYNRYYVLEKECVMGSARLAARHFQPVPRLTTSTLLDRSSPLAGSRAGRARPARTRLDLFRPTDNALNRLDVNDLRMSESR